MLELIVIKTLGGNMIGIGTDIIEIERIEKVLAKYMKNFPLKLLSEEELIQYEVTNRKSEYLAGRFAAKEAVLKALGTGLRDCSWTDISITNNSYGKPIVTLNGKLLSMVKEKGIKEIQLSISHSRKNAVAFCIIL